MFFDRRRWKIAEVSTPEKLARMLTSRTWCLCNGFVVSGHPEYLFLNDSTCEDGIAEFGVIKGSLDASERQQVESITFGWCTEAKAISYIRRSLAGEFDRHAEPVTVRVETPEQHGRCRFCG